MTEQGTLPRRPREPGEVIAPTDAMGLFFAVFNGHKNDADRRARALMKVICPKQLETVEALEGIGGGIMAIFNAEPCTATTIYAALVAAYVNEDKPAG